MLNRKLLIIALGCCAASANYLSAQTPRQAARQERRDARQDTRQDIRANNQGIYFSDQTWAQLNPWFTRNNIQPMTAPRVGAAIDAAADTAQRATNAATNATERAVNAGANLANRAADATQQAASNAANAAAGAANRAAANVSAGTSAATNARYGYSSATTNSPQGWFYDYYSYSPTYYSAPASGSNYYSSASRYYDYNNDGIYDSLSTYKDADTRGAFQSYDRLDFNSTNSDKNDRANDFVSNAQRHTVTGTVNATKNSKVNGSENLVVRLDSNQNNQKEVIVDLGPADRWKANTQIKEGDKLTATGPMEQIGDKQVVIAESVTVGQQKEVMIARSGPTIEGQVVDVTRAEVKGSEHVMAVIQSEKDRQIVDLGPAERLKVKVEPQTKIVVQGVPVQFRNYSVVLADRIDFNGQAITIERW